MTGAFGPGRPGRLGQPPADSLDDFKAKLAGLSAPGRPGRGGQDAQDGPPGRPRMTPQDGGESFTKALAQASGGKERPGILPGNPANRPTNPMSVRSNELSAMDRLKGMVAGKAAAQDAHDAQDGGRPGRPAPKGKFVPGEKPKATGPTKFDVLNKPKHQERLKAAVAEHETKNPGKKLMGPGLMSIWNRNHPDEPLNNARAGRIARAVNQARDSHANKQVADYMRAGAAKALKGDA